MNSTTFRTPLLLYAVVVSLALAAAAAPVCAQVRVSGVPGGLADDDCAKAAINAIHDAIDH